MNSTPRSFTLRLVLLLVCLCPGTLCAATPHARTPVVFATDIGGDIDDTWALAMLLRSPELDLKMVLTETGEARYRAMVAAKFLEAAGRTDVAVALGRTFGTMEAKDRLVDPWLGGYDLMQYPGKVHEDGVSAFLELVKSSPEPVTVIAVGPVPSLAAAVQRDPQFAARCRFVGMFGSFDVGYGGDPKPSPEWNVKADVPALRTVLGAPWRDILLTPLDTCGLIILHGDDYRTVWQAAPTDKIVSAVIESYCIWAPRVPWMKCDYFTTKSSTLFDAVAVYLAYAEDLVNVETVPFRITDDGMTVRDPAGPFKARVALRWRDQPAFETHLAHRVLGQAR